MSLWDEGYILAEPDDQTIEGKIMGFVEAIDEIVRCKRIGGDAGTIDGEKGVAAGKGCPLVAVNERMVLREAFPEGRSLLDKIGIIASLRTQQGGLEKA